jgi:hypothetical protein
MRRWAVACSTLKISRRHLQSPIISPSPTDIQTLIKISSNILSNPSEAKYRELKAANNTIKSKILDVKSGHEFLILVCAFLLTHIQTSPEHHLLRGIEAEDEA